MKFRYHRGGYQDSMSTCIKVNNKAELLERINAGRHIHKVSDVAFKHVGLDDRNGWDTYNVMSVGKESVVIGISDGIVQ